MCWLLCTEGLCKVFGLLSLTRWVQYGVQYKFTHSFINGRAYVTNRVSNQALQFLLPDVYKKSIFCMLPRRYREFLLGLGQRFRTSQWNLILVRLCLTWLGNKNVQSAQIICNTFPKKYFKFYRTQHIKIKYIQNI